jgi:replicative DNA helicase
MPGQVNGMDALDVSSHKLPPQNIEAEQSILGGILIENDAINKVMETLTRLLP